MRNHEILERHENEESCGQSIARHRASFLCAVTWDQTSRLFFTFASFVFFVVNNPGDRLSHHPAPSEVECYLRAALRHSDDTAATVWRSIRIGTPIIWPL